MTLSNHHAVGVANQHLPCTLELITSGGGVLTYVGATPVGTLRLTFQGVVPLAEEEASYPDSLTPFGLRMEPADPKIVHSFYVKPNLVRFVFKSASAAKTDVAVVAAGLDAVLSSPR